MNYSSNNTKRSSYVLIITGIIFFFYLTFPPSYSYPDKGFSKGAGNKEVSLHIPRKQGVSFIIAFFKDNLILEDITRKQIVKGCISKNAQRMTCLFEAFIPVVSGYGFLYYYKKRYIREINQQKHLLAFSMGGHAPPQIL